MDAYEKMEAVRESQACFQCLKARHGSWTCKSNTKCDVVVESNPCSGNHHSLLHDSFSGKANHSRTRQDCSKSTCTVQRVHPCWCYVKSVVFEKKISTLLDPSATLSLVTHLTARKLNLTQILRGMDIMLEITKVGNVTEVVKSTKYSLTR